MKKIIMLLKKVPIRLFLTVVIVLLSLFLRLSFLRNIDKKIINVGKEVMQLSGTLENINISKSKVVIYESESKPSKYSFSFGIGANEKGKIFMVDVNKQIFNNLSLGLWGTLGENSNSIGIKSTINFH